MCEEACFVKPGPDWLPRLMVIDGCNIGRSACGMGREAVNCAGLMAVIRWLLVRDFDVVAFLPVVYNNSHNFNAVHVHLLTKLEELGLVTFTPARTGRGERKAFINYDDLYVTTLAARHGGCVLSGDKFKDILAQSTYSEFHPVIINRTLDVKFRFLPHEVVHHGVDVFYRALPELFIYEDVEIRASVIAQKIFASPDDPEYSKVLLRRESWNETRKEERISIIDDMMAELCERNAIRPLALENLPGYNMDPYELFEEEIDEVYGDGGFLALYDTDSRSSEEGLVNDHWTSTTGASGDSNQAVDFSLIDFSEELAPLPHQTYQTERIEQPIDPFDILLTSTSANSWDARSSFRCNEGSSQNLLIDGSGGQLILTSSQEDVLKEIAAHVDTLITNRDRLEYKSSSNEQNFTELISLLDVPASASVRDDSSATSDDSEDALERGGDMYSGLSVDQQWSPENALLEEEISYNNTPHDEDVDFRTAVVDSRVETVLSSVFPPDIVQQVLAVNASRNIDFLADQCAQLCA